MCGARFGIGFPGLYYDAASHGRTKNCQEVDGILAKDIAKIGRKMFIELGV